ncbi:hypothetical protein [Arthrobacter sp. StoSoilB22]|uniref:hypothetical protein n=1 Tax=Arthrobacter sp. StoSoilB22 TaxID=2830996 RepID=UPI001CC40EF8|nr:hypothetical protein [Arthrobacter sp. StoSoilB22]BCW61850.1 hypothetical protein StoSoilB22_08230 [Arthrobacter sp. StoSoilB22]
MPKFSTHVALMNPEYQPANFGPGDDVPEWAIDLVGDHVLEPEAKDVSADASDFTGASDAPAGDEGKADGDSEDAGAGDSGDASDAADEASKASDDAPDFTAPAPARRGRPRKQ